MYLANFTLDDAELIEAIVHVRVLASSPSTHGRWRQQLAIAARALVSLEQTSLAYRIRLADDGSLAVTYMAMSPRTLEPQLRRAMAAFTRADVLIPGSIELPGDRTRFDTLCATFPQLRALIEPERQQAGRSWLACDHRAGPGITASLDLARALGYGIAWQIATQPFVATREMLRSALQNSAALDQLSGRPEELLAIQQRIASNLSGSVAVCEEIIGAETPEAARWLGGIVAADFRKRLGASGLAAPGVRFEAHAFADAIAAGALPSVEAQSPLDRLCCAAIGASERDEVLTLLPLDLTAFEKATALPTLEPPPQADAPVTSATAAITAPIRPYAFVSYQHRDGERVRQVLRVIESLGFAVWFDEGIPGGSEWDAILEQRIAGARVLLLFLSDSAVQSRYVRREVKYADALGKMILTLKLGEPRLEHGLAMLLTQYQMLDLSSPDFRHAIVTALTPVFGDRERASARI